MEFTMYRGSRQVGGTCIELKSGSSRILLDLGMPLNDKEGKDFLVDPLKGKKVWDKEDISDLKQRGILPEIEGLYQDDKKDFDAILLSHSHGDHFGLLHFANPEIPVIISPGAMKMIETLNAFVPRQAPLSNIIPAGHNEDLPIGGFIIKPYLMDHSAFDARGFFITEKSTGKTLFYSGDFRASGHKKKAFEMLVDRPPMKPDYLVLEGTSVGRGEPEYKTEKDAQRGIREVLKQGHRLVLVACSGQNIDRICSLYAEARNAGYALVIDPYVACVLENIKDLPYASKVPSLTSPGIRTLIHNYGHGDKYVRLAVKEGSKFAGLKKLLGLRKLRPERTGAGKYVVLVRDGIVPAIKAIPRYKDAFLIYSQWQGYLKKSHRKLTEFIFESGLDKNMKHIHSSGHADVSTLQSLAAALNPGKIIPVHTEHPEKYTELFGAEKIRQILDDTPMEI
ncbi:MAG: MBL fold metallo-hydrolase [Elusimicrobia bacterium]|nr:MBL fold metallo-hydrolase [Elusimicrobiota bacterium]